MKLTYLELFLDFLEIQEITEILDILEIRAQICLNVSRMMQGVIGATPPRGVWGGGSPPKVSTPFLPGSEKKKSEVKTKSCFKLAENRAASSLWVGGHR